MFVIAAPAGYVYVMYVCIWKECAIAIFKHVLV